MYTTVLRHDFSVLIKSDNHETCLFISKKIKKLCDAWFFEVSFNEHKSARKGEVLSREIMITHEAYPSNIVLFSESMRAVCSYFDITSDASVLIKESDTLPKDAVSDIFKKIGH